MKKHLLTAGDYTTGDSSILCWMSFTSSEIVWDFLKSCQNTEHYLIVIKLNAISCSTTIVWMKAASALCSIKSNETFAFTTLPPCTYFLIIKQFTGLLFHKLCSIHYNGNHQSKLITLSGFSTWYHLELLCGCQWVWWATLNPSYTDNSFPLITSWTWKTSDSLAEKHKDYTFYI